MNKIIIIDYKIIIKISRPEFCQTELTFKEREITIKENK